MSFICLRFLKKDLFYLFVNCTFFKGNFVQVFECLVCSRVARNSEMMALGFGKYSFQFLFLYKPQ